MSEPLTRRILEHIGHRSYEPAQVRQLARELGIPREELDQFRQAVGQLVEAGEVVYGSSETIALPPPGRTVTGLFRLNARGFGFISPDRPTSHGDLFVPAGKTGGAMTGDRVVAAVKHEPHRARGGGRSPYTGVIKEIVQRADNTYVGNLVRRGGAWLVEVDGKRLTDPILIRDLGGRDLQPGAKVVVELVRYPGEDEVPEGVITEVLGEGGEPDIETLGVIRAYGLQERFPDEVLADARAAASEFKPEQIPPGRLDLTDRCIVTIDPPDARDFDDAIDVTELDPAREDDHAAWELGVHIADVSHFVRPGTSLDAEARSRGNSTYLPRRVVPMLPELLSNGVCSLQEGVPRFTKSVMIRFNEAGRPINARFANAVIKSARRLTYLEAQALIEGDLREAVKHSKGEGKYPRPVLQMLKKMDALAKVIRHRRLADGMIVLDLPEVELVFDESGRVVDAVPEDDAFTHTLIEMFMVEANEAAARLFHRMNLPMIRRIHPDPPSHDVNDLRQFARIAGFNIPANPTRKELQTLLDAVRGKPAQHAVHMGVLQTLSKAEYAPLLIGHFALASEHYTHFTSPIRRYPDLVVHRALDAYFEHHPEHGEKMLPKGKALDRLLDAMRDDPRVLDDAEMVDMGRHCSATERNSEAAERDLRNYLVLELMAEHLGDDFDGTVTGVTSQGLFIQIDRYLVDGFIKAADLAGTLSAAGDRWRLNRQTGQLVAQRSGRAITIGDRFTVRVSRVEPAKRLLELVVLPPKEPTSKKRRQPAGARAAGASSRKLKQIRRDDRKKSAGRKGKP